MLLRARHLLTTPGTPQTPERREAVQRYLAENGGKTAADLRESSASRGRTTRASRTTTTTTTTTTATTTTGGAGCNSTSTFTTAKSARKPGNSRGAATDACAGRSVDSHAPAGKRTGATPDGALGALASSPPRRRRRRSSVQAAPRTAADRGTKAEVDEIIPRIEVESMRDWGYLKEKFKRAVLRRAKRHVVRAHQPTPGSSGGRADKKKRGREGSLEADVDNREEEEEEEESGDDVRARREEEEVPKQVARARKQTVKKITPVLDKWADDIFDLAGHGVLINGLAYDRQLANRQTEGESEGEGVEQPDNELHRRAGLAGRTRRRLEREVARMRTTYPSLVLQVTEARLFIDDAESEEKRRDEAVAATESERGALGPADMEVDGNETADLAAPRVLGGIEDAAATHRRSMASLQRLGKVLAQISGKLARAETVLRDELSAPVAEIGKDDHA